MSGHKYLQTGNLFGDDDDDGKTMKDTSSKTSNKQIQVHEQKRSEIEQRTLQSSQRSIGLLIETEVVGVATMTELDRQGEQLKKTNQTLDSVDANLSVAQRHLNGLKSMFGGFKSFLSNKTDEKTPLSSTTRDSEPTVDSTTSPAPTADERFASHPTTRLRNKTTKQKPGSDDVDKQLNENLDVISGYLTNLKGMAVGMNEELEAQNTLIEDISLKVDNVGERIAGQNQEMNKIMGKK